MGSGVHKAAFSGEHLYGPALPAWALRVASLLPGRGQGLRAHVESACYRTHIWSTSGPYTGDVW